MAKFFRHPAALVESKSIGKGTRVWAYAHVMAKAVVGENCNIGDHCFVESGAVIGNRVTIKNGVSVWDHIRIEDDVFLGPNAVLTNDLWPRSGDRNWRASETVIEKGATIGANATILCGIRIGSHAMIGAGAVVTKNVPPFSLCYGNPARVRGWVCICTRKLAFRRKTAICVQCGRGFRKAGEKVRELKG
jgi:UDP-2-acetamido-3-amino-2,3-dideoxy-glucuronate N-acetyltransferase